MDRLRSAWNDATAKEDAALQNHPIIRAVGNILQAPENANIGAVKSFVGGVGGLLKIIDDAGKLGGGESDDIADYMKTHPGTTLEQGQAAVQGGYKGPTSQGREDRLRDAANFLMNAGKTQGFWQGAGGVGEKVGELLTPLAAEEVPVEGARALPYAQRLKQQVRTAQFLADSPKIAKLAAIGAQATAAGLRSAAETGLQTFVHTGGDTAESANAALVGGVTGAGLAPGVDYLSDLASRAKPAIEDLFGVEVPTLASQRPGGGPRGSVEISSDSPFVRPYREAQQAAAPQIFGNIARQGTFDALEAANAVRFAGLPADTAPPQFTLRGIVPETTTTEPATIPGGRVQVGRRRVVFGKGAADQPNVPNIRGPYPLEGEAGLNPPAGPLNETDQWLQDFGLRPVEKIGERTPANMRTSGPMGTSGPTRYHMEPMYQYTPARLEPGGSSTTVGTGGGDIITNSPELAQWHVTRLNDLLEHPPEDMSTDTLDQLRSDRDELQQQLDMHNAKFSQMPDVPRANSALASNLVHTYADAHDQLQQAVAPYMARIDRETNGAVSRVLDARATAGRRGDVNGFLDADNRLDTLIDNSNALSPAERAQVNSLRDKARIFGGLNTAVENAANIEAASAAQVRGGRVLSGTRLRNSLDTLAERFGGGDRDTGVQAIKRVIGDDGWNSMRRMQDLLSGHEKQQKDVFHVGLSVVHALPRGAVGALAGQYLGGLTGVPEARLLGGFAGAYTQRVIARMLATSPRALTMFDYAIRHAIRPELAGALISNEFTRQSQNPPPPPEEETGGQ